jgi:hypothetical protein
VSDYTSEMFLRDFEKVIPLLIQYRSQEKLEARDTNTKPEYAVLDMVKYFAGEYGNAHGTDYHMRFLSVMQFVEHYQKDLESQGLLKTTGDDSIRLPDIVIKALLDSIKPPQPSSLYPSSPLYNRNHEFNYKKVIKVIKSENKPL